MLPRRPAARLFLGGFTLVATVHLVAQLAGADAVATVTQVLLMPLLAGVLWCETSSPRSRLVTLVLIALGLSWLGDSAPKLTSGDAAFLVMIGFFLLAQVAYIAAFLPFRDRSVLHVRRPLLLVYVGAVAGLVLACAGGAAGMLVPVLVYGACLGTTAVLATGVNRLTALGGALFLVSDGLIALGAFAPGFELPVEGFWVMSTYVAAQVLLVLGVLREQAVAVVPPATTDAVRAR
ncbi:MAG TPA: lysoplasmalogenase [Ornithinibacter sp.]|nr:lysoplasmalogenase [Ornithinibacter sp.]